MSYGSPMASPAYSGGGPGGGGSGGGGGSSGPYRGPPMHEAMQRAREEMNGQYYSSAISILSAGLSKKLTPKQRERMLMLRGECHSSMRNHEKALQDILDAQEVSNRSTPQPFFMAGRELLAMLRVKEAVEAFDMAQVIMDSPPAPELPAGSPSSPGGSPSNKPSEVSGSGAMTQEAIARNAWALVGVDPDNAPKGITPPLDASAPESVPITYEWSQDYDLWNKSSVEARALVSMLETHTIPRNVVQIGSVLLRRKVDEVARRSLVLLVQNETHNELRYEFDHFFEGAFLKGYNFPNVIQPGEVGIAAVHNNSWKSTVKGLVAFSFHQSDGVLCFFENPLMGSFRCEVKCCPVGNLQFNHRTELGRQLLHEKKAISEMISDGKRFRAIATSPSAIQVFTVTNVNTYNPMQPVDVVSVLEFLPSFALKKASVVCREWRSLVNNFPPQYFYDITNQRRAYPDYCCPMDVRQNPFTIPDPSTLWQIKSENGAAPDRDDFSMYDANGNRLFNIWGDLAARTFEIHMAFGTRRVPSLQLVENWVPMSKNASLKLPIQRTIGRLVMTSDSVKVTMEALPELIEYTIRHNGERGSASKASECVISRQVFDENRPTRQPIEEDIATVYLIEKIRRGAPILEVEMRRGADLLVCGMLAFYCRVRFAGQLYG